MDVKARLGKDVSVRENNNNNKLGQEGVWDSQGTEPDQCGWSENMRDGGDGTGEEAGGQTLQSFEGRVENFGLHSKKNWKTLDVLCRRMTCSKAMLVPMEKTFDTDKNICG